MLPMRRMLGLQANDLSVSLCVSLSVCLSFSACVRLRVRACVWRRVVVCVHAHSFRPHAAWGIFVLQATWKEWWCWCRCCSWCSWPMQLYEMHVGGGAWCMYLPRIRILWKFGIFVFFHAFHLRTPQGASLVSLSLRFAYFLFVAKFVLAYVQFPFSLV